MSTTTAAPTPATITPICFTSVHATACTPPNIVYSTVGRPMPRMVSVQVPAEHDRQDDAPAPR